MLVFSPRRVEAITMADGIEVHRLRVGRDGLRLGVKRRATLPIHRQEMHAQICTANRAAANPAEPAASEARLKGRLR